MPHHELLLKALLSVASAVAGVLVGWSGSALTMAGRIDAIEAGQQRLESMMTTLILSQAARTDQLPPPLLGPRLRKPEQ